MKGPDGINRSVKPRSGKTPPWLPIIVIDNQTSEYLCERTGEVGSVDDLPHLFLSEPASIVVTQGAAELVANLDDVFGHSEDWQYRVTPLRREIRKPGRKRPAVIVDTVVNFFGFRGPEKVDRAGFPKGEYKPGRWYYPLDPFLFSRSPLPTLLPGSDPKIIRLMTWAKDVRAFCQAHGLRVTTSSGGLAGQLLRDPRFYPQARRKVPRRTNTQARPHLPGNYYKLFAEEGALVPQATYLDMTSAHHHVAAGLTFPHADRLMRRGEWRATDDTDATVPWGQPRWSPGTKTYSNLLEMSHGLLQVRLLVPDIPPTAFPLPYLERPGLRSAFIYTNEIPYIYRLGASIEGIDAAWTSFHTDAGLNRYATWALSELATMTPERKVWAKPALLAAYGILAARPTALETGHRRSRATGEPEALPAGKRVIKAYMKRLGVRESPTANVIQRGMIEAQTRIMALELARMMYAMGHPVLSIYADSVFVQPSGPLPLLPAPWSVKAELTNLVFLNAVSFTSDQMRKLPGIPSGPGRTKMRQARAKIRAKELVSVRPDQ